MAARRMPRAFTILELLVVIGIIGILIAISLVVGNAVSSGSKQRITLDTIRVLDASLDAYIQAKGSIPDPWVQDPRTGQTSKIVPIADARNMSDTDSAVSPQGNQLLNSVGLYIAQVQEVSEAKAAFANISGRFSKRFATKVGATDLDLPTVFDGWGRPIRYVHPAFQGVWAGDRTAPSGAATAAATMVDATQFPALAGAPKGKTWVPTLLRRNHVKAGASPVQAQDFPDSDGGRCTGGRPYFYSAGDDGDPSTTGDNVYSTSPDLPPAS